MVGGRNQVDVLLTVMAWVLIRSSSRKNLFFPSALLQVRAVAGGATVFGSVHSTQAWFTLIK
jgi:hypothetical protein